MGKLTLSDAELVLLRSLVERRDPSLAPYLDLGFDHGIDTTLKLTLLISDEFVEFGLDEVDEPTRYGLTLEGLLDSVNRAGLS